MAENKVVISTLARRDEIIMKEILESWNKTDPPRFGEAITASYPKVKGK